MRSQKVTVFNPIEYFPVTDVSSPRKTRGSGLRKVRREGGQDTLKMNVMLCFLALCMIRFATNFLMKSFKNLMAVKSKILFLFNNIDPFICRSVAAFIFEIMNCRHDHVISKVT